MQIKGNATIMLTRVASASIRTKVLHRLADRWLLLLLLLLLRTLTVSSVQLNASDFQQIASALEHSADPLCSSDDDFGLDGLHPARKNVKYSAHFISSGNYTIIHTSLLLYLLFV